MKKKLVTTALAVLAVCQLQAVSTAKLKEAVATVKAVGGEGRGNVAASEAWRTLSQAEAGSLVVILSSMDDASPLAANWLRGAVHAIADRELAAGRKLPVAALRKFINDTERNPRARRFAFDLIEQADAKLAKSLVPDFINDPSVELRRDAVQGVIDAADAAKRNGKKDDATRGYQKALRYARDVDQIQKAVGALREFGQTVDVPKQFGFLMDWQVVGPFDNTEREGFARVFPPEKGVQLGGAYPGKEGEVKWQAFTSEDEYGLVDMNTALSMKKGVTAYAFTEFEAQAAGPAELRLGSKNAWKIWVNGKFVFGRDEYHRGKRIDQYHLKVNLKAGINTILVKVCQDEQEQPWTKEWDFQLRVSDSTGAAVLAKNRRPTPSAALNPPKGGKKGY
ncbi:MAG: hypothetical protein ISQ14_06980 [Verrucomicrobiae bacterium]|nr:hypothetical protein [Verrucomicrobiae bacterium]